MLKKFCVIAILLIQSVTTLKIISDEVKGKAPCISQCVGLVKPNWRFYTSIIYGYIDISECGFVSRPIVTVTTEYIGGLEAATGGDVFSVKNTKFAYYMLNESGWDNVSWKLAWTATGYVC